MHAARPSVKVNRYLKVFMVCLWVAVCFVLSQVVVAAFVYGSMQVGLITSSWINSNSGTILLGTLIYVVMFGLLVGIPRLFAKGKVERLTKVVGLDRMMEWRDYPLAIAGLVVYFLLAVIFVWIAALILPWVNMQQTQEVGIHSPTSGELLQVFFLFVVVAPIIEEIIFRGYLYGKLRSYGVNTIVTALIVSALFGLAHMQWNVAINVFALSIAMCAVREISGTIWPTIVMHMLKNGLAFYLLFVIQANA